MYFDNDICDQLTARVLHPSHILPKKKTPIILHFFLLPVFQRTQGNPSPFYSDKNKQSHQNKEQSNFNHLRSISSLLVLTNVSNTASGQDRSKDPNSGISNRTSRVNAVNGDRAGQIRAHTGGHDGDGSAAQENLGLDGVAPKVPPKGLAERGINGVKLLELVVFLGLARGDERGEEESSGGGSKGNHQRQGVEVRSLVGRVDGSDSGKGDDEHAGQDKARRQNNGDGVDGDGEDGNVDADETTEELAVVNLGVGLVDGRDGSQQVDGSRGGNDFHEDSAHNSDGADQVESRQQVTLEQC